MRAAPSLNGHQLKLIAIGAMLIDHIAWAFVKDPLLGQVMHAVGRITAPIMCFFIAQGYRHTRSVSRYFMRLAAFAAISQIPFSLFLMGRISLFPLNVLYTLALGLLAIHSYERFPNGTARFCSVLLIIILSLWGDWSIFAIFFCLLFHISQADIGKREAGLCTAALILFFGDFAFPSLHNLYHLGILLSLPLLRLYNGERGGGKYGAWFFYLFYPAHLLVLYLWGKVG